MPASPRGGGGSQRSGVPGLLPPTQPAARRSCASLRPLHLEPEPRAEAKRHFPAAEGSGIVCEAPSGGRRRGRRARRSASTGGSASSASAQLLGPRAGLASSRDLAALRRRWPESQIVPQIENFAERFWRESRLRRRWGGEKKTRPDGGYSEAYLPSGRSPNRAAGSVPERIELALQQV